MVSQTKAPRGVARANPPAWHTHDHHPEVVQQKPGTSRDRYVHTERGSSDIFGRHRSGVQGRKSNPKEIPFNLLHRVPACTHSPRSHPPSTHKFSASSTDQLETQPEHHRRARHLKICSKTTMPSGSLVEPNTVASAQKLHANGRSTVRRLRS